MSQLESTRSDRIARMVWLVLAIIGTAVWVAAPASQWTSLLTICRGESVCSGVQLNVASARALEEHGLSLTAFAAYTAVVLTLVWILWYGLAALIIWRKPGDRGAVPAALFLIILPTIGQASLWLPSVGWVGGLVFGTVGVFGLLFPDGRFAPRWTRWLAIAGVIATLMATLSPPLPPVAATPAILFLCAVVGVQIYRYRYISPWAQRQQIKWALVGFTLGMVGYAALVLPLFVDWSGQFVSGSIYSAFSTTAVDIVLSAIPVSIAIAVLRGGLWDIDRVINRALLYSALSVMLAAIYIGSVITLHAPSRGLSDSTPSWLWPSPP